MEKLGLLRDMSNAVTLINNGRRGHATKGKMEESFADFERGIALAHTLFDEAIASGKPDLMLTAEFAYTAQELVEVRSVEPLAKQSAEAAVRKFDDAALALEAVSEGEAYHIADKTFPHENDHRYTKDRRLPNDAFHRAMVSNFVRLKNGLTIFGLLPQDIDLLTTRRSLCNAAQKAYADLQRQALDLSDIE